MCAEYTCRVMCKVHIQSAENVRRVQSTYTGEEYVECRLQYRVQTTIQSAEYVRRVQSMYKECRVCTKSAEYVRRVQSMYKECRVCTKSAEYSTQGIIMGMKSLHNLLQSSR